MTSLPKKCQEDGETLDHSAHLLALILLGADLGPKRFGTDGGSVYIV
jgi:hypothetical protein